MSEYKVGDYLEVVKSPVRLVKAGSVIGVVELIDGPRWITDTQVQLSHLENQRWIGNWPADAGWELRKVTKATSTPLVGNPKYNREIKPNVFVDVYDVLSAFKVTDPCLQHLMKKALAVGQRGHKDARQDLVDIRDSAQRALDSFDMWASHNA